MFDKKKVLPIFESCTKSIIYVKYFSKAGTNLQAGRTGESPAVISMLDIDLVHSDLALLVSPNLNKMCTKNDESQGFKTIPLTQGLETIIDSEDYDFLSQWKWYAHKDYRSDKFYVGRCTWDGKKQHHIKMHRIIMNAPRCLLVDHKDGNPLNNQKSNLRICTRSQNNSNRIKSAKRKMLYKGVYEYGKRRTNQFQADIRVKGKTIHLGWYGTQEEAARAYDKAALKYYGDFACINFPDKGRRAAI